MTSQSGVTVDVKLRYTEDEFIQMVKDKIRNLYVNCIWDKGAPSTDACIPALKNCMRCFWNEHVDNSAYGQLPVTIFDVDKPMDNKAALLLIQTRIMPQLRPFVGVVLSNEMTDAAAGIIAELVRDVDSWFREPATTHAPLAAVTVGPENGILAMQRLLLKL